MFRKSSALARGAKLAAVAASGCVVLAACGPVQLGAAAIMGGQRISTASLATQVSDLTRSYHAEGSKAQLGFPVAQMPQQVLAWLVRFRVRETMASQQGIRVSVKQQQQAISEIEAQAHQGGQTATLTQLAVANGLPPDLISDLGVYQAIADALVNRLDGGHAPTSQTAQQALSQQFNKDQCLAAKSLHIKINPQYGRVDYTTLGIVAAPNTLSAPGASASPSASPSAAPRYVPPC
ncbi:MAG TPA: hypothetical protein VGI31_09820 [Streptosporangiaceae bacterium]